MTMTKDSPNIYQRISAVTREVRGIKKDDKKVNNQYRAISHEEVTRVIQPSLIEHGIVIEPSVIEANYEYGESKGNVVCKTTLLVGVAFVNIDNPTDRAGGNFAGMAIDSQDKGPGKAISYAIKTAILKTFTLESRDEDYRDIENEQDNDFYPSKQIRNKPESHSAETNIHEIKLLESLINNLSSQRRIEIFNWMTKTYKTNDITKLNSEQLNYISDHLRLEASNHRQNKETA